MKKIFNKEVITYILMMLPFVLMAIFTYIFTRNSFDFDMYGFQGLKFLLFWIGFTLSWLCLFFLIFYLLPRKKRIPFYIVFDVIWHVVFCAQICSVVFPTDFVSIHWNKYFVNNFFEYF